MEHESLSYTEAIRYLANKYRIELVETQPRKKKKRKNFQTAFTFSTILQDSIIRINFQYR